MDEEARTQEQMAAAFPALTAGKIMLLVDDAIWVKRDRLWHRAESEPMTRQRPGRVRVTLRVD